MLIPGQPSTLTWLSGVTGHCLLTDHLLFQFVPFYADLALGQAFFFLQRTQPPKATIQSSGSHMTRKMLRDTGVSGRLRGCSPHGWLEPQASIQMYEAERGVQSVSSKGRCYHCRKPPLVQTPKERSLSFVL